MKKVLIFANESQFAIEIIQNLIAKHFQVHVFTTQAFKSKEIFIDATPLQLSISIMNLANYYNWKHDIIKYDVIINTLTYNDFTSSNQNSVFANFTHYIAETTLNLGKKVIYLSSAICNSSCNIIQEAENTMLKTNPDIFYLKYVFLVNSHSNFLLSVLNSKYIISSQKVLNTKLSITTSVDIQNYILNVINNQYTNKCSYVCGESFTFMDIIALAKKYNKTRFIIKIPHIILKFISHVTQLLPKNFYPAYISKENLQTMCGTQTDIKKYTKYPQHTLLANILERHSKDLFQPKID
jgi:hypothetical protein